MSRSKYHSPAKQLNLSPKERLSYESLKNKSRSCEHIRTLADQVVYQLLRERDTIQQVARRFNLTPEEIRAIRDHFIKNPREIS